MSVAARNSGDSAIGSCRDGALIVAVVTPSDH